MPYFNYHAKIKNLIKNGHCNRAFIVQKYKDISPALVLCFDNHKPLPIRNYHFEEYFMILEKHKIKIEKN